MKSSPGPWFVLAASCVSSLAADIDAPGAATGSPAPSRPTLFLIGDSTVKNGRGDGAGGLWGWGQVIAEHFDSAGIKVENRALGGRSSRTFLTEGLWDRVLAELKPGDFVLMQFGHNDGGELAQGDRPRASLKGNGDEARDVVIERTGQRELVRTYGWYLRKYIADAKAKGASPIVLSPVPRNIWKDGRVARATNDYGRWAAGAATAGEAAFIDLNEIVARRYEAVGQTSVQRDYFTAADHTHTTQAGARVNAECVVEGLRELTNCPARQFLVSNAGPGQPRPGATDWRFDFGSGNPAPGFIPVQPTTVYSRELGHGFDLGSTVKAVDRSGDDPLRRDFVTSERPFFFSVTLAEGNYDVTVTLGDLAGESVTTVKAESRRLMLENVRTSNGRVTNRTFTVNIRTPVIAGGGRVRLKDREQASLDWDDKLTLEFGGDRPCVTALEIKPAPDAVTVYLTGDSTVTDQPDEPWNSWGQMLTRLFKPGVAIANHAESGESIRSSLGAHRLDKVFSTIGPGDYLFVQFGHNDMKDRATNALAIYQANLERIVAEARRRGATPVLMTSMERKAGVERETLGDYPKTVRAVAKAKDATLVDLHALSRVLYHALGTNLDRAFQDGTHHNAYGSYELAKCVVEGIRQSKLPLARFIVDDLPPFDPSQPDPPEKFAVPPSPQRDLVKPDGN